jgi:hypothetical protein
MSQLQVTGEAKIRDIQGPVVSNSGVITALDGDASQYVRGDGTLADFPTSTGGGSSVSYYLNSSVSQGTIGGVAYRQLGKTPIIGVGTDITISANGYVASYITDANDPALLEVPAGNFNCEFYFSVNSNAHNPYVYAEVYKYDGTTFTLIGTSVGVPEYLSNGTTLSPYYFAIPVSTSVLTVTDRISIRIYVNVDGRTVTLHTENGHLCQVVTTFSKGLTSLNNLTRQVQFFGTGTSGTDFGISSSVATHTFNLPIASATNTGKLSSTDWSTFNGKVPYTGATANVDLGDNDLIAQGISGTVLEARASGFSSSPLVLRTGTAGFGYGTNAISLISSSSSANTLIITSDISSVTKTAQIGLGSLSATRTFTLPDLSGTLALLEGSQTFTGGKTFSFAPRNDGGILLKNNVTTGSSGYVSVGSNGAGLTIGVHNSGTNYYHELLMPNSASYNYTYPSASGTIALTSNLSSYVPYTGATGDVNLGNNILNAGNINVNPSSGEAQLNLKNTSTGNTIYNGFSSIFGVGGGALGFGLSTGSSTYKSFTFNFAPLTNNTTRIFTFPDASGTLALTSDLSAYVTLATAQTISGAKTFSLDLLVNGLTVGKGGGSVSTNTAIGTSSLQANTGGSYNTAIGLNALKLNTNGANNTSIGADSLSSLTTGINNTAIGYVSGSSITTGSNNTIIGNYAGTAAMSNNIVLADGAGNIRYQWNGTNNVFGNPISGTSATFSSTITAAALSRIGDVFIGGRSGTYASYTDGVFGDNLHLGATSTGGAVYINTALNRNLIINPVGGNVGIGCTPSAWDTITNLQVKNASLGGFFGNTYLGANTYYASAWKYITTDFASRLEMQSGRFEFYTAPSGTAGNNISFTQAMTITSGGDVGIGNTAFASTRLTVTGKSTTSSDFSFVANNSANSNLFLVRNDGTVFVANLAGTGTRAVLADSGGALSAPVSDKSVKENITSIGYGLNEILKMNPVWFDFIDEYKNYGEGRQNGNIAQEMQEIIPEAVFVTPSTGKMGINYDQLHAVYIKAIQQQQQQIEELKELIKNK